MAPIIPFDDRDGYIWMNGKMLPWRDAKLHSLSHGLHYGSSVFEGERVYDGHTFKLREHTVRLLKSGEYLDFKIPYTVEEIEKATREVLTANNITDGYLRPVAWRGSEQMAVSAPNAKIHLVIACWQWPKYFFPKGGDNSGLALKTSEWRRPPPNCMPVQAKCSGNYTIGTLAKHAADRAGFDDAFLLDYKGRVAESSGSNIFCVKGKKIKTPTPECFLNGITRQTIIVLARELGFDVEECEIMPADMKNFDEVFVTGTAAEVAPVSKIDDNQYQIGAVTNKIKDAYAELVRRKPKATAAA
jgi:branched-chain amino acid aminotransferase